MAQPGRKTILFVNVGTDASPNWQAPAQQQGLDINRGLNTTTVGHKDSAEEVTIAGTKVKTISFGGLLVRTDVALAKLRSVYEARVDVKIRIRDSGNDVSEFLMKVTAFNESEPHDGVATYAIDLASSAEETEL